MDQPELAISRNVFWISHTFFELLAVSRYPAIRTDRLNGNNNYPLTMGFCPECGSMLIPSKGLFKCRKCGYVCRFSGKGQIVEQTEPQWCFCHRYRCPHKDYSICPEDCEEPGPMSRCINICEFKRQHPKECEKITIKLQEAAREKPSYIPSYKV